MVTVAFHDAGLGGPLRSHERELRWLAETVELEILVPAGAERAAPFDELGASIVAGPYQALSAPDNPAALARGLARARREEHWFRERFRQTRPRLAFAASSALPAFLLAAHRAKLPSVVSVAELWIGVGRGPMREAGGRALLGLESRLADAVIACSDRVARQFGDNPKVTTIHPGIDERQLRGDGAAFRRAHGIAEGAPMIACVGNITRGRGQDVLLRAVSKLLADHPGLRCVLQGEPFPRASDRDFAGELDRLAAELGVAEALVTVPAGPVGDVLAAADLVVNPATTHPESFGRVPLEAGLAGTPSVCSEVGALGELHLDGVTTLLVAPGDPDALAGAIALVLDDPALARRLAAACADLARTIADPDRSLAEFKRLIEPRIG